MKEEQAKFLSDLKSFVLPTFGNNLEQAFWVLAAKVATDSERIDELEAEVKGLKEAANA